MSIYISKKLGEKIHRYIRLTYLIPQLLDLVDNDVKHESPSIAFRPAVEISYLSNEEQKFFYDTVKTLGKTPSVQQATRIKQLSKDGTLTQTNVMEILVQDKPNQKETVRVDYERLGSYFKKSLTPSQCEKKVLDFWNENDIFRKSMENRKEGETYTFYDGPMKCTRIVTKRSKLPLESQFLGRRSIVLKLQLSRRLMYKTWWGLKLV